jgi:hypothetical protein
MRKALVVAAMAVASLAVTASAGYGTDNSGTSSSNSGSQPACGTRGSFQVVGLTSDQRLVCFRPNSPERARTIGAVSNLQTDTSLVGIDYRPADGQLYGVGDKNGIYTLDVTTGMATLKSRLNVAGVPLMLSGTFFGTDFNPAADRFRIVSDNGQNLRVNVEDGSTNSDGTLNYMAATANGVTGAAYTNNDADSNTGTTLFDFDSLLDQVAIQSPPNNGSLVATGKFGVDSGPEIGADIYSRVKKGSTIENHAFAALRSGGLSRFYEVDVLTGKAWSKGAFAAENVIIGVAIPLNQ